MGFPIQVIWYLYIESGPWMYCEHFAKYNMKYPSNTWGNIVLIKLVFIKYKYIKQQDSKQIIAPLHNSIDYIYLLEILLLYRLMSITDLSPMAWFRHPDYMFCLSLPAVLDRQLSKYISWNEYIKGTCISGIFITFPQENAFKTLVADVYAQLH